MVCRHQHPADDPDGAHHAAVRGGDGNMKYCKKLFALLAAALLCMALTLPAGAAPCWCGMSAASLTPTRWPTSRSRPKAPPTATTWMSTSSWWTTSAMPTSATTRKLLYLQRPRLWRRAERHPLPAGGRLPQVRHHHLRRGRHGFHRLPHRAAGGRDRPGALR